MVIIIGGIHLTIGVENVDNYTLNVDDWNNVTEYFGKHDHFAEISILEDLWSMHTVIGQASDRIQSYDTIRDMQHQTSRMSNDA